MTHYWRIRKWLPERHGQRCKILSVGAKNQVLIEFEDGTQVVTIRYFVRKL